MRGGGYNYHDNPQYDAYTSLFETYTLGNADIVFTGDSLISRCDFSEFFPEYTVANRGIGSDTTEGLMNRLDSITELSPNAIVIMIGINDVGSGIESSESIANVRNIVNTLSTELPECQIILLSVLPCTTQSIESIKNINTGYREVASGFETCQYIDAYSEFMNDNGDINSSLLSKDGVHLTGAGYQVLINDISNYLN